MRIYFILVSAQVNIQRVLIWDEDVDALSEQPYQVRLVELLDHLHGVEAILAATVPHHGRASSGHPRAELQRLEHLAQFNDEFDGLESLHHIVLLPDLLHNLVLDRVFTVGVLGRGQVEEYLVADVVIVPLDELVDGLEAGVVDVPRHDSVLQVSQPIVDVDALLEAERLSRCVVLLGLLLVRLAATEVHDLLEVDLLREEVAVLESRRNYSLGRCRVGSLMGHYLIRLSRLLGILLLFGLLLTVLLVSCLLLLLILSITLVRGGRVDIVRRHGDCLVCDGLRIPLEGTKRGHVEAVRDEHFDHVLHVQLDETLENLEEQGEVVGGALEVCCV